MLFGEQPNQEMWLYSMDVMYFIPPGYDCCEPGLCFTARHRCSFKLLKGYAKERLCLLLPRLIFLSINDMHTIIIVLTLIKEIQS